MANAFCSPITFSNFPLLNTISRATIPHKPFQHKRLSDLNSPLLSQPLIYKSYSSKQRGSSLIPFNNAKRDPEPKEEDGQALETVLKLYKAIKSQNMHDVSNVIGDECRCVCNFFSFFQAFQGKQQVLEFFNCVMRFLGNNIEFVIQPTINDGMNIGISWKLEWGRIHIPIGKGFSFYICQIYQGKITIRNVEMFMEPLLRTEPFRLNVVRYVTSTMEKMCSLQFNQEDRKKAAHVVLFIGTILLFMKPGLY